MLDTCIRFGENNRLHGILTVAPQKESSTTVLIVSAGFTSTSGPYRLNTLLCRRLVDFGISSMRFDLGGLGESLPISPEKSVEDRTNDEIKLAIDYLEKQKLSQKIILLGLCSGAEDSFRYAKLDSRIAGVVMIDPHSYPTSGFYFRYYFGRPMYLRIKTKLKKIFKLIKPLSVYDRSATWSPSLVNYQYMKKTQSLEVLKVLLARKTLLHYIFTGGAISRFNYPNQVDAMFPEVDLSDKVSIDHLPMIEHTQVYRHERDTLINAILNRLQLWESK